MRNLLVSFLTMLLLSCMTITADAGFVVNKNANVFNTSTVKTTASANTIVTNEKHNSFFSWLHPYGHGGGRREARIAFFFAMWGLLFAPLGILAIIHGARSLRRARGRDDGLAITSIIIGGLEVLVMILFIFLFFLFFI